MRMHGAGDTAEKPLGFHITFITVETKQIMKIQSHMWPLNQTAVISSCRQISISPGRIIIDLIEGRAWSFDGAPDSEPLAVAIPEQNRSEYKQLLEHALEIEIENQPYWLLVNSVMQRRAKWLLARSDEYFSD